MTDQLIHHRNHQSYEYMKFVQWSRLRYTKKVFSRIHILEVLIQGF